MKNIFARIYRDQAIALSFLTRLPTRFPDSAKGVALAEAAWMFPVVGLIVGVLVAAIGLIALAFQAPTLLVSVLVVILTVLLTGALHEDGLADTADGLGGGATVERKLEIMRDSSVGTYGIVALCISVVARIVLVNALLLQGVNLLVIMALALAFSRTMMLIAMSSPGELKAGGKGLGASAGIADPWHVIPWFAIFASLNFWFASLSFIMVLAILPPIGLYLYAKEKLGGITGDIYGAIEQVGQVAFVGCLLWHLA